MKKILAFISAIILVFPLFSQTTIRCRGVEQCSEEIAIMKALSGNGANSDPCLKSDNVMTRWEFDESMLTIKYWEGSSGPNIMRVTQGWYETNNNGVKVIYARIVDMLNNISDIYICVDAKYIRTISYDKKANTTTTTYNIVSIN